MSIHDFDEFELKDVIQMIEEDDLKLKFNHTSQYIATLNAVGQMLSKNYKYIDIFKDNNKKSKELSEDEYNAFLEEFNDDW